MKRYALCLTFTLIMQTANLQAAFQSFPVKNRVVHIDEGRTWREVQTPSYAFHAEVISDDVGIKAESGKYGRPLITVQPGERYAVRLYNPLPVRVAVNLTIDGLNSITGKPSGITDGEKWIIDPYSFITLRGWQVNGAEARRFFFTDKPKSYAKWQGDQLKKDLSANCGVIGAAFFWNQDELDRYYEDHPIYRYPYYGGGLVQPMARASEASNEKRKLFSMGARAKDELQAGTGMGERESNPTTVVDFRYDTGMYRLEQALVIYYDFAKPAELPNPFPALSYAPEMP